MKTLLFVPLVLLGVFVANVAAQEGEGEGGGGGGFFSAIADILRKLYEAFREIFSRLHDEIAARTADIGAWTREAIEGIKKSLHDWVQSQNELSAGQKKEMDDYIENLEFTTEAPQK